MKRWALSAATCSLIAVGLLCPAGATAQPKPSCAAGKTGKPAAITAREAWELARARARGWQADAVPFNFTTTSVAPLDADGRSTDWEINFSSEKAKAVDMISVSDGQIRGYALSGAGGRARTRDSGPPTLVSQLPKRPGPRGLECRDSRADRQGSERLSQQEVTVRSLMSIADSLLPEFDFEMQNNVPVPALYGPSADEGSM